MHYICIVLDCIECIRPHWFNQAIILTPVSGPYVWRTDPLLYCLFRGFKNPSGTLEGDPIVISPPRAGWETCLWGCDLGPQLIHECRPSNTATFDLKGDPVMSNIAM